MKYLINKKLKSEGKANILYGSASVDELIDKLADSLTQEQYRELNHQLYLYHIDYLSDKVTSGIDDRYQLVQTALNSGLFWNTLAKIDSIHQAKSFNKTETSIISGFSGNPF